jgi:hypothetical protein
MVGQQIKPGVLFCKDKKGDALVHNHKAQIPQEFSYGLGDWQLCFSFCVSFFLKDAQLTKAEALDFSIIYVNYSFNLFN